MKTKKIIAARFLIIVLLLSITATWTGCGKPSTSTKSEVEPTEAKSRQTLTIAAGPAEGLYYAIAESIGVAVKKGMGYDVKIIETTGSLENVKLLEQGKTDLAISMLDMATHSYKGTGIFQGTEGNNKLRLLMELYPSYVQIVTTEDTGIKSFQDLKYKRVGIGAENSGTEWNAKQIFEAYGMTYEDCLVEKVDTQGAMDKINSGELDAALIVSGAPNAIIQEIERDKKKKLVIVPIGGDENTKLTQAYSFFPKGVIPENTYGKNKAVETISVINVLAAGSNLSDEMVEKIMTCISDNIVQIQAIDKMVENINLENALKGTTVPIHPGVARHFSKVQPS